MFVARIFKWLGVSLLLPLLAVQVVVAEPFIDAKFDRLQQIGLLLLDRDNHPFKSKDADKAFIPASTTKLMTAYLALKQWGAEYRFHTDFYLSGEADAAQLWVKGYGDPFLVSEELALIAGELQQRLQQQGIKRIAAIRLDSSYFAADLQLPGGGRSDNPYDAIPAALAANFNTLYLKRRKGKLYSAEEQTPLTPTALKLGATFKGSKLRFNSGRDPRVGERYFGELLAAFLRQQGVEVAEAIEWQVVPESLPQLYRHHNSQTLADLLRVMLKYSTNFVANQLALMLAAEQFSAPATAEKVAAIYKQRIEKEFGWSHAHLEEGAGLSHNNRISPNQLVELLQRFEPWQELLPEVEPGIFAKSGTLEGVSTLAGYIVDGEQWLPFALMINQQVPFFYRNKVAKRLAKMVKRGG